MLINLPLKKNHVLNLFGWTLNIYYYYYYHICQNYDIMLLILHIRSQYLIFWSFFSGKIFINRVGIVMFMYPLRRRRLI